MHDDGHVRWRRPSGGPPRRDPLSRLPLRDAARASVLSVAWGRSWRRLSDLDFTCDDISRKAIDAVLRHHSGPVRGARFKVTDAHLPGVHGWTLSLAQQQQPEGPAALQSLHLAFCNSGPPPPVPAHAMFAPGGAGTRALRDLVLALCVLPPVPASFFTAGGSGAGGFPSLARLRLSLVIVHEGGDLEAMVSMAPKLEELSVGCITVLGRRRRHELRMASHSLRFLEMGAVQSVEWVAACLPRVEHARLLDVDPHSAANLLRGMASSVHKLVIGLLPDHMRTAPTSGLYTWTLSLCCATRWISCAGSYPRQECFRYWRSAQPRERRTNDLQTKYADMTERLWEFKSALKNHTSGDNYRSWTELGANYRSRSTRKYTSSSRAQGINANGGWGWKNSPFLGRQLDRWPVSGRPRPHSISNRTQKNTKAADS